MGCVPAGLQGCSGHWCSSVFGYRVGDMGRVGIGTDMLARYVVLGVRPVEM